MAIVTLHLFGRDNKEIAERIPCTEKSVRLWIERWEQERSVKDKERSGHPRCTTEEEEEKII
jgi:transposase